MSLAGRRNTYVFYEFRTIYLLTGYPVRTILLLTE